MLVYIIKRAGNGLARLAAPIRVGAGLGAIPLAKYATAKTYVGKQVQSRDILLETSPTKYTCITISW